MQLVVNAFTENRLKLSLMDMFCHSVYVQALQLMEYMFVLDSSTMELKLTREGGATRAPISIDLARDGALRHSLQDRICKSSGKIHDEIYYLKLRTSTDTLDGYNEMEESIFHSTIELTDLPRVDKGFDDSLLVVFAFNKIDQAASEPNALAAVQALLLGQGSQSTSDIPWIALFGETVYIASAQSGNVASENSL
ncbi:hypothetical protein Vadar_005534 [Vaccinium darrowii]|uniref:Uncharacterized protein n=1 Tax=Vaccinium darrowii TaxID=229202 RepID=A0ACB7WY16_9ERIC|nr:hypothetical protein Vadar_005534 [Vaccinium darrowii]